MFQFARSRPMCSHIRLMTIEAAGIDCVLPKPLSKRNLLNVLDRMTDTGAPLTENGFGKPGLEIPIEPPKAVKRAIRRCAADFVQDGGLVSPETYNFPA